MISFTNRLLLACLFTAAAAQHALAEGALSQLNPQNSTASTPQQISAEKVADSLCADPAEMAKGYENFDYMASCLSAWETAYAISLPRSYRSVKAICASPDFNGNALCAQYLQIVRAHQNNGSLLAPAKPFKFPNGLTKTSKYAGFWKDCTTALQSSPQNSQYSDNTRVRYSGQEIKDICSDWVARKMTEGSNFPAFPFMRSNTFLTQPGPRPCECTYKDNGGVRTYTSGHGYVVKFLPEDVNCQFAFFKVALGAFECMECSAGNIKACLGCLKTTATGIDSLRDGCIQNLCVPINEFFGTYPGEDPKCDSEHYTQGSPFR